MLEHAQEPQLFLSPAQAARLLGVSRQTVYRAIASGELPAVVLRGQYRLSKRELARTLLASRGER